jgi:hypothetical protein
MRSANHCALMQTGALGATSPHMAIPHVSAR